MTESLTLLQALSQFHFLRPLWLLALIPALFFFSRLWRLDAQGSAWHKVIDQSLLPYLLSASKSTSQRLPLILLIAAWVISVLALAGPTWSKQTQPVQERQEALVIVLDLSLGMFANDQDPNRITVARRKIMDLLDTRREGQTGLVVYAGEAHMVTPLTDDSVTIRAMIPALSPNIMPVVGNNPAEAIAMANSLMDDAAAVNGRILLITANVPRDQNADIQDILSHNRYPLHIIGVGTPRGAAIPVSNGEVLRDNSGQVVVSAMDRGNLQALSSSLNGRYSDISINASDLETVLSDSLLRGDDDSYLESEEEGQLWQDAGPWLLLLLLPLCALCFRRGWVLQLALGAGLALTLLPSPPAQAQTQEQPQEQPQEQAQQQQQAQQPTGQDPLEAQPNAPTLLSEEDLQEMAIGQGQPQATPEPQQGFDIRSLWLNRDQRGVRYLEEGDPYTAATLFETPEWQGAAAYRAGDYQAAINAFSQSDDIDSIYNLGNALAFAERLEEAIAAYERVLAQDPEHADALRNKQIVEDLLEEQQQQQQEQEQQEQEEQEQQESQSESESDENEQDQQQEQEEQEQQEQSQDQQQQEQESENESENADQGQQRSDAEVEQEEDQESLEQFLRRIEDDPGELLQRKFQFESRRRMIERRTGGQNAQ